MKVFKNDLIDELEAELLNQYLDIVWLEDFFSNGLDHLELYVTCALEEKSNPRTVELIKRATDIQVNIIGKKNLDSQCFQTQLRFTVEEYNGIYEEMSESSKDARYDFIKKYGYSISDLICILDRLAALRKELEELNDKEKFKFYKEIIHSGFVA